MGFFLIGQLYSHQSGWGFLANAPPRPSINVMLIHDDGTRSDLDIILRWYTGKPVQVLVLTRRDRNGNLVDAGSRQLSDDDIVDPDRLLTLR